mgnify:CR=1 FL=1
MPEGYFPLPLLIIPRKYFASYTSGSAPRRLRRSREPDRDDRLLSQPASTAAARTTSPAHAPPAPVGVANENAPPPAESPVVSAARFYSLSY